jgi:NADPH-dependent 2,4-dienoyl-CoA reductase/sulfur reductase-like enzyme
VDLVGSARQHYADPKWTNKAAAGQLEDIRKCVSCLNCMRTLMEADDTGVRMGCSINIATGRERDRSVLAKTGDGRTVAVIGAGPAGLEAARVLALRGFRPVLFEKKPRLGGQLLLAAAPPGKAKLYWLLDWLKRQIEILGVETRLSAAPSVEVLKKLDPYAVIVAQGSKPLRPASIPGSGSADVHSPWTVLEGRIALGGPRTLVVGSGLTGIETALYLASRGQKVSVYEMASAIGPGVYFQKLIDILARVAPYDVAFHPGHKLVKISGLSALFERTADRQRIETTFDDLVLALGAVPETTLVEDIKAAFERVLVVGDAARPGRIREAVEHGYEAAFTL